jgi:glycosyltransferase involved in cell wall biosynthesis
MNISHTFVICAYKESEYLEDMVRSIMAQTVSSKVLMTTSTPNAYIRNIADKYHIELKVRDGRPDIRDDWNFAYNSAETEWVTLAHQDDMYSLDYVAEMVKKLNDTPDAIAFLTDYIPIKHNSIGSRDENSKIRRFLRRPLLNQRMARSPFWKKEILAFGNSICCPSVTYHKSVLGPSFFTTDLKYNIDWDTFLKFSKIKGSIAYVDKPLTFYRISDEATSAAWIKNHTREREDRILFSKFWPKWFVNFIMIFYVKAYDTYKK